MYLLQLNKAPVCERKISAASFYSKGHLLVFGKRAVAQLKAPNKLLRLYCSRQKQRIPFNSENATRKCLRKGGAVSLIYITKVRCTSHVE